MKRQADIELRPERLIGCSERVFKATPGLSNPLVRLRLE
jgi:hypothetical protein